MGARERVIGDLLIYFARYPDIYSLDRIDTASCHLPSCSRGSILVIDRLLQSTTRPGKLPRPPAPAADTSWAELSAAAVSPCSRGPQLFAAFCHGGSSSAVILLVSDVRPNDNTTSRGQIDNSPGQRTVLRS